MRNNRENSTIKCSGVVCHGLYILAYIYNNLILIIASKILHRISQLQQPSDIHFLVMLETLTPETLRTCNTNEERQPEQGTPAPKPSRHHGRSRSSSISSPEERIGVLEAANSDLMDRLNQPLPGPQPSMSGALPVNDTRPSLLLDPEARSLNGTIPPFSVRGNQSSGPTVHEPRVKSKEPAIFQGPPEDVRFWLLEMDDYFDPQQRHRS